MNIELEEFDILLLQTIDEILRDSLGDINTEIIYGYLQKRSCSKSEIPQKLEIFSDELRTLLGGGRGQILGTAQILENTIVKVLCFKLKIEFDPKEYGFTNYIRKLKEIYEQKKTHESTSIPEMEVVKHEE